MADHPLTCGCVLCARLLAGANHRLDKPATQEDLLCDSCRAGTCAGAMHYHPVETLTKIKEAGI